MSKKKHTKHIKTKKIQQLERADKMVWLIPVVTALYFWRNSLGAYLEIFRNSFVEGVVVFLSMFISMALIYVPIMMIWRAFSNSQKNKAIKETTFSVFEDFEYYRDELTGISPATISMCVDLDIEIQKDITAQILKYSLDGIVEMKEDKITILNKGHPGLKESDRFLLDTIEDNSLDVRAAEHWKKMAKEEIIDREFIKSKRNIDVKNSQKGLGCSGCLGCLPFFLITAIGGVFLKSDIVEQLMALEAASNTELFSYFKENPIFIMVSIAIIALGIGLFASMVFPFTLGIRFIIKNSNVKKIERTEAGQVLTEEIYGLKNFIRDFSNLSSADKERLVLWDDFLVYAVILEENTQIVDEIMSMRNIKLVKIKF